MARILLGAMPFDGHVAPVLPIARTLVARGHDVRMYTGRRYRQRIEATGATYEPMHAAPDPGDAELEEFFGVTGRNQLAKLKSALERVFTDSVPGQVRDLRALYGQWRPDVAFSESAFVGPAMMHELGVGPVWGAYNTLPLTLTSRDTAPFGLALKPVAGPLGWVRNAALNALIRNVVFRGPVRHADRVRGDLGLPATRRLPWDAVVSPYLYVQGTVASFEYPRSDLPPQVHFVGPALPVRGAFEPPVWWAEVVGSERPVVHVTQGTLATDAAQLLAPALRALAGEDVLVVVTTGGQPIESLGVAELPPNARVASFIPHMELLRHVDAMVTNGGYNGVQASLAHAIPLVVAGGSEDKPEVAARVAWSGVGIDLRSATPSEGAIRRAVRSVLDSDRYRERARTLADEIAATDAAATVAGLIEELAFTQAPVLARPAATIERRAAPITG